LLLTLVLALAPVLLALLPNNEGGNVSADGITVDRLKCFGEGSADEEIGDDN
jgi:hypothetical protein